MFGIIIATHGELAWGLVDAVKLIMGEFSHIEIAALKEDKDINEYGDELVEKIKNVDSGKGVLVFTDIFGASPNNQAALKKVELSCVNYKIISGVNLPMLLEAIGLSLTSDSIEDTWQRLVQTGKESIKEFETELNKIEKE